MHGRENSRGRRRIPAVLALKLLCVVFGFVLGSGTALADPPAGGPSAIAQQSAAQGDAGGASGNVHDGNGNSANASVPTGTRDGKSVGAAGGAPAIADPSSTGPPKSPSSGSPPAGGAESAPAAWASAPAEGSSSRTRPGGFGTAGASGRASASPPDSAPRGRSGNGDNAGARNAGAPGFTRRASSSSSSSRVGRRDGATHAAPTAHFVTSLLAPLAISAWAPDPASALGPRSSSLAPSTASPGFQTPAVARAPGRYGARDHDPLHRFAETEDSDPPAPDNQGSRLPQAAGSPPSGAGSADSGLAPPMVFTRCAAFCTGFLAPTRPPPSWALGGVLERPG
jgi:hypothetical protein